MRPNSSVAASQKTTHIADIVRIAGSICISASRRPMGVSPQAKSQNAAVVSNRRTTAAVARMRRAMRYGFFFTLLFIVARASGVLCLFFGFGSDVDVCSEVRRSRTSQSVVVCRGLGQHQFRRTGADDR